MGQIIIARNIEDLEDNIIALVASGGTDTDAINAIKAVTDNLPQNGTLLDIGEDTLKIDSSATSGLLGVDGSVAYRIHEAERHMHSYESWFELAAVPDGEVHRADRIGSGAGPFVLDAGNDDWGGWVQILGSADTPARGTNPKYDLHKILFSATERNLVYFFQIAFGATGDAAVLAGDYTESAFMPASNQIDSGPVVIQDRRQDDGTLAWARCMCPDQDTGTMNFYFGLHEYEG